MVANDTMKASEIEQALLPLIKAALPTREEVRARCPSDCPACIEQIDRVSIYGFDKILRTVISDYQTTHQTDPEELHQATMKIRDQWYQISKWDD